LPSAEGAEAAEEVGQEQDHAATTVEVVPSPEFIVSKE
jgi:hypothetical protein